MSKSQSKEFFKKKQRGQNKKNSTTAAGGVSIGGTTMSTVPQAKDYHVQTSLGSATGLLGGGEDPAVVVLNPHPPTTHQAKEKRTKLCCLL